MEVLVSVIGPGGPALGDPHDGLSSRVASALARGLPVIPFVLDGAHLPSGEELPESLEPLAGVEPIRATDEYWDAAVDRLVERLPQTSGWRRSRLPAVLRRHPRISIGSALGAAGTIVSILAALGYFNHSDPEQGTIAVGSRVQPGVTAAEFMTDFARVGQARPEAAADVPRTSEGYVYRVEIGLERPEGHRYEIRWTIFANAGGPIIKPFRNRVGDRFSAGEAAGSHEVWVPCPPTLDAVPFVVQFFLTDSSKPSAPPLKATDPSDHDAVECRKTEG